MIAARPLSLLWLVVALLPVAASAGSPRTGVETLVDPRPGGQRTTLVEWIEWNSPFRAAGLRIGDRVLEIDGEPLPLDRQGEPEIFSARRGSESSFWRDRGKGAGDTVKLGIERGGETLTFTAPLSEEGVVTKGADGHYRFGADGPKRADETIGNMNSWYRGFREVFQPYLVPYEWSEFRDSTWVYPMRRTMMDEKLEQLTDLEARHPSVFTSFLREIADRALVTIAGEPRTLGEDQLEWRRLGEIRAQQISAAAEAAQNALFAELGGRVAEKAFPVPDPSAEPIDEWVGKIVLMEPATQRDILFEAGDVVVGEREGREITSSKSFLRHASRGARGVYFTPRHTARMWSAYDAIAEYSQQVIPVESRDATIQVLGRVLPDPILVSDESRGNTEFGLQLLPLAVIVRSRNDENIRFFADLRTVVAVGDVAAFAGQDELTRLELGPHDATLPPRDVLLRFVDTMKYADYEAWKAMFADWELRWSRLNAKGARETRLYDIHRSERDFDFRWTTSRQALLDEEHVRRQNIAPSLIYDVEIYSQTPTEVVHEATERFRGLDRIEGDPIVIEETTLFVRFVGRFEGAFRTFSSRATVGYNTYWRLQRRNGGPWMIAGLDAL